jgi:hypothetical protein
LLAIEGHQGCAVLLGYGAVHGVGPSQVRTGGQVHSALGQRFVQGDEGLIGPSLERGSQRSGTFLVAEDPGNRRGHFDGKQRRAKEGKVTLVR